MEGWTAHLIIINPASTPDHRALMALGRDYFWFAGYAKLWGQFKASLDKDSGNAGSLAPTGERAIGLDGG